MDETAIRALARLNNEFYRVHAASFSATRQRPWQGWHSVLASLPVPPKTVLDVACGNMRFKAFLEDELAPSKVTYYGVDSCGELAEEREGFGFQQIDLVEALLQGGLETRFDAPSCDLVASFGFMHHVPTQELRKDLLKALLKKIAPKGVVAVSFWQFANDPKLAAKAEKVTARARVDCSLRGSLNFECGDYLLGWNDEPDAYRYCHSFTDSEIDELAESASGVRVIGRFRADGGTVPLNTYLLFSR